jgi:3-oxoacyl-[acyl-carrier-protein] synthase-3
VQVGKIESNHIIAIAGFGAGLSWGSAVFRWG